MKTGGMWVGDVAGLRGPIGPEGPQGPAGSIVRPRPRHRHGRYRDWIEVAVGTMPPIDGHSCTR